MNTDFAYMLDTNVFNDLLDGKINLVKLKGKKLYATHIQRDEITNTKNAERREDLLSVFKEIIEVHMPTSSAVAGISVAGETCAGSGEVIPTTSFVLDVSRLNGAKLGRNDGLFSGMLKELNELNKSKDNNIHDILIAETSIKNGLVLITTDKDLSKVVTKYGGNCQRPEFL